MEIPSLNFLDRDLVGDYYLDSALFSSGLNLKIFDYAEIITHTDISIFSGSSAKRASCLHKASNEFDKDLSNWINEYEKYVNIKLSDEITPLHIFANQKSSQDGKILMRFLPNREINKVRTINSVIIAINGMHSLVFSMLFTYKNLTTIPIYKKYFWKSSCSPVHLKKYIILNIFNDSYEVYHKLTINLGKLLEELRTCKSVIVYCYEPRHIYRQNGIVKPKWEGHPINPHRDEAPLLHMAVAQGALETVELLLKNRVNLDRYYLSHPGQTSTLLFTAIAERNINMVQLLLKYHADPNIKNCQNVSPIQYAIKNYYFDIAQLLLDNFAVIEGNKYSVLSKIINSQDISFLQSVLERYPEMMLTRRNRMAIYHAINCRNDKILETIMAYKIDLNLYNQYGHSPLYHAIYNQNITAVKLILKNETFRIEEDDILHFAIELKNKDIFRILMKHTNNIENRNECGETPLIIACRIMNVDAIIDLLDKGANVNAKCQFNMTPVMYCARSIQMKPLNHILSFNPDLGVINNAKKSVLRIAYETYCRNVLQRPRSMIKSILINYVIRYSDVIEEEDPSAVITWLPREIQSLQFVSSTVTGCVAELLTMRRTILSTHPPTTLFDVMTGDVIKVSTLMNNPDIYSIMINRVSYMQFRYYGNLLKRNYNKALRRCTLCGPAIATIQSFSSVPVPYNVGYYICQFLSNTDLEALKKTDS